MWMGKVSSSEGFVGSRTQAVIPAPLLCWVDCNFWGELSEVGGGGGGISKRGFEEEKVKNHHCPVFL